MSPAVEPTHPLPAAGAAPMPQPLRGAVGLSTLVAALLAAGCSPSPPPAPATPPTPAPAPESAADPAGQASAHAGDAPAMPATEMRQVMFGCAGDEQVEMRFFPQQGVAVLVREGQTLEMHPEPVAAGFAYRGGTTLIRGKDDELQVETEGEPALVCRAQ